MAGREFIFCHHFSSNARISTCKYQEAGLNSSVNNSTVTSATNTPPTDPISSNHPPPSDSSKKRKASDDLVSKASQNHRKIQNRRINEGDGIGEQVVTLRKSAGTKRATSKSAGSNCNNGNNKEGSGQSNCSTHVLQPSLHEIGCGFNTSCTVYMT
ncbi:unnamed protein product [Ilex paraguariensis]|uniref:Uncharacterized protein n=1 Tax=Ilex paraguariensis TaxID=185542 RepID=A0ABC8RYR6_9AQUA